MSSAIHPLRSYNGVILCLGTFPLTLAGIMEVQAGKLTQPYKRISRQSHPTVPPTHGGEHG